MYKRIVATLNHYMITKQEGNNANHRLKNVLYFGGNAQQWQNKFHYLMMFLQNVAQFK
jgi:hypothetical protein